MKLQKLLYVDDDPINLEYFEWKFRDTNVKLKTAKNGKEALEQLKTFYPDLILTDNIMPEMTGWELIKVLKQNDHYKDIPIIVLSAVDDFDKKDKAIELGASDYIYKPASFPKIMEHIENVLTGGVK